MASTEQFGPYRVQERNMVIPDGAKVWVVLDASGKVVFSSNKHAARLHAQMLAERPASDHAAPWPKGWQGIPKSPEGERT
jgi:hypothetical protein